MSSAREEVLGRIRAATRDVPRDEPPAWAADADLPVAHRPGVDQGGAHAERFAERAAEYRATVTVVGGEQEIAGAVAAALGRAAAGRVAVAPDLPPGWLPPGLELVDGADAGVRELDRVDAVVTGCAAAIAETGTIVLDGGAGQGPRRMSLLPDVHVCVVRAADVHSAVPDALRALGRAIRAGRPLTLVSGPSATSDIELDRVEGVHGPRTLELVLSR